MAQAKTAERTSAQSAPKEAPAGNLPAQQQPKQKPAIVQFREYVNQRMATLDETLPPHIHPAYFVSAIMVALQKKPSLLECTFASIWNACVEAAKDGLLPDGKEGAIVPYGENAAGKRVAELATWMPMIEGYRKKIFETGKVKSWEVQVVREKDEFEYELGDNAFIRHKPFIGMTSAGNVVGAYSVAKLMSGETVREVMGAYDIMQIANKSKAGNGPWKDPAFVPEMARKVVARRHYKQLPHSRELSAMIARDDERFGIDFNEADEALPKRERPQRLSSRQAFDTYAGATVDNETGEVVQDSSGEGFGDDEPDDRSANQNVTTKQEASPAATTGGASKGAGAANGPQRSQASAPTEASAADVPRASAAQKEAGASSPAPASGAGETVADSAEPDASGQTEIWDEPAEQVDGGDRPWPPGTLPTNEAEYERYLGTKLAEMTDGSKVAPWWNSQEQKDLRKECKVVRFKELQDRAIARRKELADKPVR